MDKHYRRCNVTVYFPAAQPPYISLTEEIIEGRVRGHCNNCIHMEPAQPFDENDFKAVRKGTYIVTIENSIQTKIFESQSMEDIIRYVTREAFATGAVATSLLHVCRPYPTVTPLTSGGK